MSNQSQSKIIKVMDGDKDGIIVEADFPNGRYLITTPNRYDSYRNFKSSQRDEYANVIQQDDKSIKKFEVSLDKLMGEDAIKEFNFKINSARKATRESDLEYKEGSDMALSKIAIDKGITKDVHITRGILPMKHGDMRLSLGECLHAGRYYVFIMENASDTKQYVRAIDTSKLVDIKGTFADVEQRVKDTFEVGKEYKIYFDDLGNAKSIGYTDAEKAKQTTAPEFAKLKDLLEQTGQNHVIDGYGISLIKDKNLPAIVIKNMDSGMYAMYKHNGQFAVFEGDATDYTKSIGFFTGKLQEIQKQQLLVDNGVKQENVEPVLTAKQNATDKDVSPDTKNNQKAKDSGDEVEKKPKRTRSQSNKNDKEQSMNMGM